MRDRKLHHIRALNILAAMVLVQIGKGNEEKFCKFICCGIEA